MSDNDGCHATATVGRGGVAVLRARFRMPLSEEIWATAVTTSFPDATLRLLTGVPMDDRALELGEVRADDPRAVVDAIETHPDITAYESLFVGDDRAIGQYEAAEQSLYEFLWGSSLPPEFPIVVADGVMEFDVTATREQFEAFGDALDANGREYDLLSVVHTDASGGLLTDRQRECLTVALRGVLRGAPAVSAGRSGQRVGRRQIDGERDYSTRRRPRAGAVPPRGANLSPPARRVGTPSGGASP